MTGPSQGSRRLVSLALAVLVIAAFQAAGHAYYRDFRIPQGTGMAHLLPEELAFLALFTVFGLALWALLAAALFGTAVAAGLEAKGREASAHPWWTAAVLGAMVTVACAWVGRDVLRGGVVTDDEHVYRFIAETLRTGAVVAPSPGQDLPFFVEQFVVVNETSRYGKYPLGHPLVLALAQAVHLERWVMPLVTGLIAWPLASIGLRNYGATRTVLALLLFATSPQVVFTGATYLSQPTSALCLLAGCALLLAGERAERRALLLLAASGACFGYGICARPLPGVLFAAAAVAYLWWRARNVAIRDGRLVVLAAAMALGVGALLWVNRLQAGSALTSGYQTFHGVAAGAGGVVTLLTPVDLPNGTMSIVSNLLRLDAWLFGWPLSLAFLPFARRRGVHGLAWLMLGAAMAYRIVSPKAGVGITGPQYMFEVVPLLCLLTADGLAGVAERVAARQGRSDAGLVSAVVLAGLCVSLTLFLPSRLGDLARAGRAQDAVWGRIREQGVRHALVFHDGVVPPWTGLSWAYFPRCNGPSLDDDVLFVRTIRDGGGLDPDLSFWRRRFPDRRAMYFGWDQQSGPFLVDLESFASGRPGAAR
ncbi:MAG TPA: hypothetical protein VFQ51_19035 [Vicinamibacteria bacterium]|nr:hypothetical protein [Vicinamibacteria bacterium]